MRRHAPRRAGDGENGAGADPYVPQTGGGPPLRSFSYFRLRFARRAVAERRRAASVRIAQNDFHMLCSAQSDPVLRRIYNRIKLSWTREPLQTREA